MVTLGNFYCSYGTENVSLFDLLHRIYAGSPILERISASDIIDSAGYVPLSAGRGLYVNRLRGTNDAILVTSWTERVGLGLLRWERPEYVVGYFN